MIIGAIENLVGNEGDGFKLAMKGLDSGRVNIAACSIGSKLCMRIQFNIQQRGSSLVKTNEFQVSQFKLMICLLI